MVNRKEVTELSVIAFSVFLNISLVLWALTSEGGLGEEAYKNIASFYTFPLVMTSAFFMFALIKQFNPKHPFYKEWHIHDPEESYLAKIVPQRFYNSVFKMYLISIIFFMAIGFILVLFLNVTLTQTGLPSQQITTTGKLIFSAYPGPDAETWTILSIYYFLVGLIGVYTAKKNKDLKFTLGILALIFTGLVWGLYHTQVYGSDEVNFGVTLIFGLTGIGITQLTRSVIPFLIWHQIHNLFASSRILFSDQTIIITIVLVLIALIYFYSRVIKRSQ